MDKGSHFYITTPIYYVNDVPHIGHAYTTIAADVLARYRRLRGDEVLFLTGTDEHGKKIQRSAEQRAITPQELADDVVIKFKDAWKLLNISNDDFIRTTEKRHIEVVQEIWKRLKAKGDIYHGFYEDWYCVPCESYWTEKELINGKCPTCGREMERVKEESYFFKLSKYQEPLLKYIQSNDKFILPLSRRNEIISFVKSGLRDLSITRIGFDWGVKVPDDTRHVIYVWFDALINYLTGAGFLHDEEKFKKFWPADVHIVGKDIVKFHAVYWPAFLMSAGLALPKQIFAHGWWTIEGMKMSKSTGKVISPALLVNEYGVEPTRYFLMREVPFGLDGDFSSNTMLTRINSELANDLGNLLSRTTGMVTRFAQGIIPEPSNEDELDLELKQKSLWLFEEYKKAMSDLEFHTALIDIWEFIASANRYVDRTKPWQEAKSGNGDTLSTRLYNIVEATRIVAVYLMPFMPETAKKILSTLSQDIEGRNMDYLVKWGYTKSGTGIRMALPLFEKVSVVSPAKEQKIEQKGHEEAKKPVEQIPIDTFKKIELKTGIIMSAERVKGSEKLIRLEVNIGEPRIIVAGIGKSYKPEELIGKKIAVVANLEPAKLFGIQSNGMLLAAGDSEHLTLLTFDREVSPGTRIK
ncbi:MAG: methionine--tRNA ligase [Deltaproteobacteria bacterium]|nr:methionine--tRNA ligase [Deltaproteobacteria bacterium]MCL5792810.1 methionine--tRNA ligase [Deltaproteobacteria bacterium]